MVLPIKYNLTMAKKKKSPKKRNLKYGTISLGAVKSEVVVSSGKQEPEAEVQDVWFKKELRRNLIFIASFFVALILFDILLTKTSLLSPLLSLLGLKGLY